MKKQFQKIISISIITLLLVAPVAPIYATTWGQNSGTASWDSKSSAITSGITKCVVHAASTAAVTGLANLVNQLLSTKVQVEDFGAKVKKVTEDCMASIAISFAKAALTKMTQDTFNWIQGGFQGGSPLYVTNLETKLTQVQDDIFNSEISIFNDPVNANYYPYGRGYAQGEILARQVANNGITNLQSNLSDYLVTKNTTTADFAKDFSTGGWDGWLALTQYNQNNPLGFTMETQQIISNKQKAETEALKNEVAQNNGMFSQRSTAAEDCVQYGWSRTAAEESIKKNDEISSNTEGYAQAQSELKTANDSLIQSKKALQTAQNSKDKTAIAAANTDLDNAQSDYDAAYSKVQKYVSAVKATSTSTGDDCTKYKIITPGSIIKDQISSTINSPQNQLELVRTLDDALNGLLNNLTSNFHKQGLNVDLTAGSLGTVPNMFAGLGNSSAFGELDIKDLGNTSHKDTNGNTVVDKKGIIQIQKEFIVSINSAITTLEKIMPALGELDYCIPGPNQSWENNPAYQQTVVDTQTTASNSKTVGTFISGIFGGQANNNIDNAKSQLSSIENFKTTVATEFGQKSPMQDPSSGSKYLAMSRAGLDMTKNMIETDTGIQDAEQQYKTYISQTNINIKELESIRTGLNKIIKAAQARRDADNIKNGIEKVPAACIAYEQIETNDTL